MIVIVIVVEANNLNTIKCAMPQFHSEAAGA